MGLARDTAKQENTPACLSRECDGPCRTTERAIRALAARVSIRPSRTSREWEECTHLAKTTVLVSFRRRSSDVSIPAKLSLSHSSPLSPAVEDAPDKPASWSLVQQSCVAMVGREHSHRMVPYASPSYVLPLHFPSCPFSSRALFRFEALPFRLADTLLAPTWPHLVLEGTLRLSKHSIEGIVRAAMRSGNRLPSPQEAEVQV